MFFFSPKKMKRYTSDATQKLADCSARSSHGSDIRESYTSTMDGMHETSRDPTWFRTRE